MKKLFTLFFALLVTSNLWATIIYEKNGGKFNDYEWENKNEMFQACMADCGVTTLGNLDDLKAAGDASYTTICTPLEDVSGMLNDDKWEWLEQYIMTVQNADVTTPATQLTAGVNSRGWCYAVAAFFLESQRTSWPKSADFSEAGKDASYIPAWGQSYGNPSEVTETFTLYEPHKLGYLFDGWYTTSDFSGEKVTTIDASSSGTLYAKWVLDGIVYELNGGKYNDYGWTSKADICLDLQKDYNSTYSTAWSWVKKENGVILYCVDKNANTSNRDWQWMTENDAKGTSLIATKLYADTYRASDAPARLMPLVETTMKEKYGWLKDFITANRTAQTMIGDLSTLGETFYRAEIAAFFYCSPAYTSYPKSSSYETTGNLADFQGYWGQTFPNPEHPTAEVTLNNPYKEGYLFQGWYDNEECTGTPITKVNQDYKGTLYAKWVLDGIVYELNGGQYNEYGWTSKADICYDLQVDYNAAYSTTKAWAKKEGDVVYYNIDGTWMTETEAKGQEAAVTGFLQNVTYNTNDNLLKLIETTKAEKYAWLKDVIVANRSAQSLSTTLTEGYYRLELSGFFLCSAGGNSPMQHSSFASSGDLASFQPYWGQSLPNPEHPTAEVTLNPAIKVRHTFEGWYAAEDFSGSPVTKVDENYAGTLYAKWSAPTSIAYELNGGQYNEYGWTSKADMYDDFMVDWKAYSGSDRPNNSYEDQLGVGKSGVGIPTMIHTAELRAKLITFFTDANYAAKWGWLATYLNALATQQGKTQPTTDASKLVHSLGNFFGEDNAHASDYIGAVDCTGEAAQLSAAQAYCSFTLPNSTNPLSEMTLNEVYRDGYVFDGWYASADFSGNQITKVNGYTIGTLYAKWQTYNRDVTAGQYGTICLPNGSIEMKGATFFKVSYRDDNHVYVDQVTTLEAGKAYIFKATSNKISVYYNSTTAATPINENGVYGTFSNIADGAAGTSGNILEGNYMLVGNSIKLCAGNCKLYANRAYFKVDEITRTKPSLAPGRQRIALGVQGENAATGVDNLTENGIVAPAMEGTYDIMGRKLTEPTTTGFYIINGKKVFVVK